MYVYYGLLMNNEDLRVINTFLIKIFDTPENDPASGMTTQFWNPDAAAVNVWSWIWIISLKRLHIILSEM